ncbi:hypothetical protein NQZ68_000134 [Dissostichus eleginoides]|nr:hypothetical protein NQZ68_000134 [Dissostichus eleginoides]
MGDECPPLSQGFLPTTNSSAYRIIEKECGCFLMRYLQRCFSLTTVFECVSLMDRGYRWDLAHHVKICVPRQTFRVGRGEVHLSFSSWVLRGSNAQFQAQLQLPKITEHSGVSESMASSGHLGNSARRTQSSVAASDGVSPTAPPHSIEFS